MIYEYRRYEVAPGKMKDLHDRFKKHTLKLFKKHGLNVVVFWNSTIGEATNCLTYILKFDSLATREKAWAEFLADEEWQRVFESSNKNGQIVIKVENKIFSPTEYSPLP